MRPTRTGPAETLKIAGLPRPRAYDPEWVLADRMGPNALRLAEWLCESVRLEPGMQVFDRACRHIGFVSMAARKPE